MNLTTNTEDARLGMWVAAASANVAAALRGVDFEQTTRTEYHEPDGFFLVTRFRPVASVTSVYEDPTAAYGQSSAPFASTTLLVAGTDYALARDGSGVNGDVSRSGLVRRLNVPWSKTVQPPPYNRTPQAPLVRWTVPSVGAVKITYVSGYTATPDDVRLAVCFEVDAMRARAGHGGQLITDERLGEYSYKLAPPDASNDPLGVLLSDAARNLLRPYLGMRLFI